jgi:hypothetical protein
MINKVTTAYLSLLGERSCDLAFVTAKAMVDFDAF